MRLFINSQEIDLSQDAINYTKQVNSLSDLASRQSNFSKTFKVPKTAHNIKVFSGLGITGSTSLVPYQKNTARLFVNNACIIYSGWAIPQQTNEDSFEIYTYDGNIDFFKLLDNVKFENINLSELSHTKDVATIVDNWQNGNEFFKYLVADFNGETHFLEGATEYINADYLVPSVPIKFLWERIFETFGFTFSGSIFEEEEFNNLLLTYPKGVVSGEVAEPFFSVTYPQYFVFANTRDVVWLLGPYGEYDHEITEGQFTGTLIGPEWKAYFAPEDGYYKIKTTGTLLCRAKSGVDSSFHYGKNLHTKTSLAQISRDELILIKGGSGTLDLEWESPIYLTAGESITFIYDKAKYVSYDNSEIQFNAEISKINQTSIDQIQFFKSLTPKYFYKEVMWRFGLTPFPSKDENHIEFLTYDERINGPVEDWSGKFLRKISEKYVYDGYSKSNYFRFKYNGEDDDYNDGSITIQNENLPEKSDAISSKTYSVERLPVPFNIGLLPEDLPKIELWEKEVKNENGTTVIEYKSRDSRFTFVREAEIVKSVNVGSKQLGEYGTAGKIRTVENYNYSWQRIVDERYNAIRTLFRNTKIIVAEVSMTEAEFDAFDLKPTIYIEQLGGTLLVDKISKRDLRKKETQIDLIKINR